MSSDKEPEEPGLVAARDLQRLQDLTTGSHEPTELAEHRVAQLDATELTLRLGELAQDAGMTVQELAQMADADGIGVPPDLLE